MVSKCQSIKPFQIKPNKCKKVKDSAKYSDQDTQHSTASYVECFQSIIGDFCIGATDMGLRYIKLLKGVQPELKPNEHTTSALKQLTEYFAGERREFNLDLDLSGYSNFSEQVWQKLKSIPYGKTISYLQLAKEMGDIKCIRAAASANGRNPIPIIIPCHRVIGSDGSLTGFALGLDIKKILLTIENPGKYKNKQTSLDF